MSRRSRALASSRAPVALLAIAALALPWGCVHLIAPYDEQTQQAIFAAARAVDQFYAEMLETDPGKRPYSRFSERYVQVGTELRALLLRNEVRPLNDDSTSIARTLVSLWEEKKEGHRKRDAYPDGAARLDRDRFARLFKYAARAEALKGDDAAGGPDDGGS